MADKSKMEKVDMAKEFEKLNESDKYFVRKLENMNRTRAAEMKTLRGKNKLLGVCLGVGVISIYLYSMYAVKQEKFLDFETVPEDSKTKNV